MERLSLKLTLPLLIFLTAISSGCDRTLPSMPLPPRAPKYTLQVERIVCNEDKSLCEPKSVCNEWQLNTKDEWVKIGELPLKDCDGFIAVSPETEKATRKFLRDLYGWSKSHCSE